MVMINGVRNEQNKESFTLKNGYSKKGVYRKMVYPSTWVEVISELGSNVYKLSEMHILAHRRSKIRSN